MVRIASSDIKPRYRLEAIRAGRQFVLVIAKTTNDVI